MAASVLRMVAVAALVWPAAALGAGRIPTCVEIETASGDAPELARLVKSELDRHPSHRAVASDCRSYLKIELIELGRMNGGGRFLTGRINEQVPHRVPVGPKGVETALVELLSVVLHNDPMSLRGPEAGGWLARQTRSLLRGKNYVGVEPFELFAPVASRLQMLPGLAIAARRESRAGFLGLRLTPAFALSGQAERAELSLWAAAQAEAALFFAPAADVSGFASVLVGAEYQRFRGPAPDLGAGARSTAVEVGLSLGLRGGVELLRVAETRLVIWAQLGAPVFWSEDEDGGMVDQWLPTALLGGGVVF
jgi:hypothetical protein